ncbi:MAG TPA: hypothetical protein VF574_04865 [Allosphingosinicella sp.]
MDPAFLSRILAGQAGTNLRSIAAVLCATDHVLQVKAVPMEESMARKAIAVGDIGALHFMKSGDGLWEWGGPTENMEFSTPGVADYQLFRTSSKSSETLDG